MNHPLRGLAEPSPVKPPAKANLLLVRHPEVDPAFQGICYGQSDIPLSAAGRKACPGIAREVARRKVTQIVHSGLQRTRLLAECIGRHTGVTPVCDPAVRERHFGDWELQSWEEIYQRHGDDMMRMISEPADFRPGGGETTWEFASRVWRWYQQARGGLWVVVCHGGTIASLLGRSRSLPVTQWPRLTPGCGEMVWQEGYGPATARWASESGSVS